MNELIINEWMSYFWRTNFKDQNEYKSSYTKNWSLLSLYKYLNNLNLHLHRWREMEIK